MNLRNLDSKLLHLALACGALIIVLVPFHALMTVWLSSAIGHYTAVRLWSMGLVLVAFFAVLWLFWRDRDIWDQVRHNRLIWLLCGYVGIQFLWGIVALATKHVDAKALGYGWIVDVRFLIFFLVIWALALKHDWLQTHWQPMVFWPLAVVVVFGLLQYFVLPFDVMKHFGYSVNTIYPYETINHNIHHLRIMSTLRGANPLGAYLVVAGSLLLAVILRQKRKNPWLILLGLGTFAVLILSFSRAAWLGAATAVITTFWLQLKTKRAQQIALATAGGIVVIVLALFLAFRNNTTFQDLIFHTNAHSTITTTSDQGHASAFKAGLHDLLHDPLGRGPGSAGPASAYNNHPPRIAENYFIQIGQEVGWLGLAVFVVINFWLAQLLWLRRADVLALGLFAGSTGATVVAMLSHAWTDDTLAFLWWGLAALALVAHSATKKHKVPRS